VVRGVTTKDQVQALFGATPVAEGLPEGNERWTYQSSSPLLPERYVPGVGFTTGTEKQNYLVFVFDKRGVVLDYAASVQIQ
jgi:hypothetical protein